MTLYAGLAQCLLEPSPWVKARAVRRLYASHCGTAALVLEPGAPDPAALVAARPVRPQLVDPRALPRRGLGTAQGHAALLHAIAHIEFNAINLALDAAYRFRGLPDEYYADWLCVAAEEARHFLLLAEHLESLGFAYGDFAAHGGLWQMAQSTAHDPMVRMALVPRVLEARGLDVTPAMSARLERLGDTRAVSILAIIARDEVTHVAVGSRWFRHLCERRHRDPEETFMRLLEHYLHAPPKPPFEREARLAAGFSASELQRLEALASAASPVAK